MATSKQLYPNFFSIHYHLAVRKGGTDGPTATSSDNPWSHHSWYSRCGRNHDVSGQRSRSKPKFCDFRLDLIGGEGTAIPVSYTHLRAHETRHDLVCRLLLE